MPIKFSGDWNGYEQRWERRLTLLEAILSEGADEANEVMEKAIRERILTMPNRTKEDGRVRSERMIKAVTSEKFIGSGKVVARAGWLKDVPKYLKYQEDGSSTIEAMFSIDVAQRAGEAVASEVLLNAVRRMWV